MSLPTFTRRERKARKEQLPKGAYVVKIMNAKEDTVFNRQCISILFDIAEGEYAGFYQKQYTEAKKNGEDAVWPYDARLNVTIPSDTSEQWIWDRYNEFFTAVEDSNDNYTFSSDLTKLKGKIFGGKFRNRHKNGYDNTQLQWTCSANDVRSGEALKYMPRDWTDGSEAPAKRTSKDDPLDGFVNLPEKSDEIEIPFD